jgi:hypothetical protein
VVPALLTGLLWLVGLLLLFLAAQRWLHRQIHAILLIMTRHPTLSLGLFSLIFFPGVLLHETSHYLMAVLLRVRTGKFSLLPQVLPDGTLRLGYVETAKTDVLRDALIGTAPLLTGGAVVALIGISLVPVTPLWTWVNQGRLDLAWEALRAIPGQPDFWLWFYLGFAISSTMLPSASDRRAWLPIAIPLLVLTGLAVFAGAGPWLLEHLAPGIETLLSALVTVLALSLAAHLALGLPIGLLAALVSRVTGLRVVDAEE